MTHSHQIKCEISREKEKGKSENKYAVRPFLTRRRKKGNKLGNKYRTIFDQAEMCGATSAATANGADVICECVAVLWPEVVLGVLACFL